MKMVVMKQFADAFESGKMAGAGSGTDGVNLPPGDSFLGTGNDSATALSVKVGMRAGFLFY